MLLLSTFLFQAGSLTAGSDFTEPESTASAAGEKAFVEAERLRAQWEKKSLRAAIEKYQEALSYWRASNDKAKEARVFQRIGDIYRLFGQNTDALAHHQQALKLSRSARDSFLETESLNRLCSISAFRGDTTTALDYCNRALLLSRQTGDRRGEAEALNNIGEVYYFLDLKKALASFEQALTLLKVVEDIRGQAHTLTNMGYVYTDWSDLQKALDYYTRSLTLWTETGDLSGEARTINAMGVLFSKLGEKQKALTKHTRAKELFELIGNRPGELTALTGLGFVYDSMGEKEKALDQYAEALEISRTVGQREGELVLLVHVGNVYETLNRKDEALESYKKALALSRALFDMRMEAYSSSFIGGIHEASGDRSAALRSYKNALVLSRKAEDKRGEASVLTNLGRVYERAGKTGLALDHYKSALRLQLHTKDRQGEALTRYHMAGAYRERGDFNQAKYEIETSLGIIESLRTDVGSHELRISYFASVQQYYSLYIDILMQMHKSAPSAGLEVAAFQASGRARARNLIDLLVEARADIYQSIEPGLKEKEQTVRQTLNAKSERQMRLLGAAHSEKEAVNLEKEIGDLTFELENVRAQIRDTSPRYSALIQPAPLSLENVQEMLDDNTLLLEYALGEKRSYLWAVDKVGITTYELPDRSKIEEIARRLYELLSARQLRQGETLVQYESRAKEIDEQYWLQAVDLGQMILGPVSSQLGTKRLLIVADGALLLVPFSALALTRSSEPVPLMLEHDIVSLPSTSTLAVLRSMTAQRTPATKAVVVLADPVYERNDPRLEAKIGKVSAGQSYIDQAAVDLGLLDTGSGIPRLLASTEEAHEIMRMVPGDTGLKALGFDANLDTVSNPAIAQYRIVHFATHGIFNNAHPELSGIILSLYNEQGQPRAGFLRLREIYNLNLPVELVVLSACDTALGREVEGEGLIGLTRGFMYAGAAGVMASLWKVDEDATAELMKYFYEGVLKEGLAPAGALRKAQIKMWQSKRRRSPYFWAAFVLHGEYRQLLVTDPQEPKRESVRRLCILLALLLGIYLARRKRITTRSKL